MEDSTIQEKTKPSALRPSDICFSQKKISYRFRRKSDHGHRTIGDTLDDLMEGRLCVTDIPLISLKLEEEETDGDAAVGGKKARMDEDVAVDRKKARWITADNRRLWIFRHLERLGRCKEISFEEVTYISSMKLSSENRGASVEIRDGEKPGGYWHQAPDVTQIDPTSVKFTKNVIPMSFTAKGHAGVSVITLVEKLTCGDLDGRSVPSIVVWQDGTTMSVIDGNRRLWAFQKAKQTEIAAIVIKDRQLINTVLKMLGKSFTDVTSVYEYHEVTTSS